MRRTVLDERDSAIKEEGARQRAGIMCPTVGDYVEFSCGTVRRISYIWPGDNGGAQTSAGGSFHLLHKYGTLSFSGGLYHSVPLGTLTDTGETREGACWFFHHNYPAADNGVDTSIPCRVWRCTMPAPEY